MLYMYSLYPYSKSIVHLTKRGSFSYISFHLSIFIKPMKCGLKVNCYFFLTRTQTWNSHNFTLIPYCLNIIKHNTLRSLTYNRFPSRGSVITMRAEIFIFSRPQRSSGFCQAETNIFAFPLALGIPSLEES